MFKVLFASFLMFLSSVFASDNLDDYQKFIQDLSGKSVKILSSKSGINQKTTKLLQENTDMNYSTKFVLGSYYSKLSKEQIAKFQKSYQSFVVKKYLALVDASVLNSMEIMDTTRISDNESYVNCTAQTKEMKEITIRFRVKKTEQNAFKLLDMTAEGVSLLAVQRDEFASILSSGGYDSLIKYLSK